MPGNSDGIGNLSSPHAILPEVLVLIAAGEDGSSLLYNTNSATDLWNHTHGYGPVHRHE